MNPWAGVIIVVAILLFIIAWKGTQDNVLSAILNRPYSSSSSSSAQKSSPTYSSYSPTATGPTTFEGQPVVSA